MLRHMCANLENILKIRWDQEEMVLCHLCNKKDSKGRRIASIVHEPGKHSPNSLSSGGDIFLVLPTHHQDN